MMLIRCPGIICLQIFSQLWNDHSEFGFDFNAIEAMNHKVETCELLRIIMWLLFSSNFHFHKKTKLYEHFPVIHSLSIWAVDRTIQCLLYISYFGQTSHFCSSSIIQPTVWISLCCHIEQQWQLLHKCHRVKSAKETKNISKCLHNVPVTDTWGKWGWCTHIQKEWAGQKKTMKKEKQMSTHSSGRPDQKKTRWGSNCCL